MNLHVPLPDQDVQRLDVSNISRQGDYTSYGRPGHQLLLLAKVDLPIEISLGQLNEGRDGVRQVSPRQLIGYGLLQRAVVGDRHGLFLPLANSAFPDSEAGQIRVIEHAPDVSRVGHELVHVDAVFTQVQFHHSRAEAGSVLQLARPSEPQATQVLGVLEIRLAIELTAFDQVVAVHEVSRLHRFTLTRAGALLGIAR